MLTSSGLQPSNHTLRLVDRDRLVAQRVRVIPDEKLIFKTTETAKPQQNLLNNFSDLSTDFDIIQNSNSVDLLDLGNSQMSTFFREFSENQKTLCKEEKKTASSNYKTINGLGFYYCDSCPFICLNVKIILDHNEKNHIFHNNSLKSPQRIKCIGCDNIFSSVNVLRCHLIEDHVVVSDEIDGLVQLVIEANNEDILYNNNNDEISQTENNNLADFNDTILDTSEFGHKSHFIDTQITGEINSAENYHSNDTCDDFWEYQEQASNGLQETNTIEDTNIIEKHLRCTIGKCKARFGTEDNLMYHIKCHLDDKFKCIEFECQFTDSKWVSMMTHLWKTHSIDVEMFGCNQCDFKTNSLYKLNTFHKNIHKQEKPFLCSMCKKGFKSIKQLRNHKAIHVKNGRSSPKAELVCQHCCRNFSSKPLLHQHIASVHIGVRPYTCNICGYATAVASSLKLHQRLHTGEKPFACDECGFRTADHNTLRKHKMRHTGRKNYTCPLCDYSCIQACSYKNHLKSKHPGMDDGFVYSCNMCNFKTICKDIYMLHIVKHKEETVHINDTCDPIIDLDEMLNEKEKIQAEIVEQPYYLFNTIRVKPINTINNETVENTI
ncbi:gastrula zinc finger protein xFG20-1-like [Metopolophium dirhodum]|uniref:gastrula zinc finger protein xFG20-1-like n=1 Tax=Metopolophium dirhodum TaxID=44670 RepID=UPI00298FEBDB|nr:gastrula zinc finger protein xFG20-1-like [Metopolophium dirhodum]